MLSCILKYVSPVIVVINSTAITNLPKTFSFFTIWYCLFILVDTEFWICDLGKKALYKSSWSDAQGKRAGVNLNNELNEAVQCEWVLNEGWLLSL